MKWFDFQEELRDNVIKRVTRSIRRKPRAEKPKMVNSVAIPLAWLLESSAKLKRVKKSKYVHIIVTGTPPKDEKGNPVRNKAKVMIPGVDYELYIEGYGYQSPTLGNIIGICEEFPPKLWP